MHGALLSGLREASCIYHATRRSQNYPGKVMQKNVGPSSDMLEELFKKPDLEFGNFSCVFDPSTEDPKSIGLVRVGVGSSENSYKQELSCSSQHAITIPLQLYTFISHEQACGLELVTGEDESRLSYLVKVFGLRLIGPSAIGTLGNSLAVSIANGRRGSGRNRTSAGRQ